MKGLIISGGEIKDYSLLEKLISEHDYIVCVDSGFDYIKKTSIKPDLIIGDLDSISNQGLEFVEDNKIKVIKYPIKKNKTDTELAIDHLIEKNIKYITLTGVTGSRLDHSLTNIHLLKMLADKEVQAKIVNDNNTLWYVRDRVSIKRRDGYYISIIPLTLNGIIVTLKGFLYPLTKTLIQFGSSLAISNEIVDLFGEITIHKGQALIIESKD